MGLVPFKINKICDLSFLFCKSFVSSIIRYKELRYISTIVVIRYNTSKSKKIMNIIRKALLLEAISTIAGKKGAKSEAN